MEVILLENAIEISKAVSSIIIEAVQKKPTSVLGFATGDSPIETYKRMIEAYENGEVSFKDATTFNLDEYCGLPKEDENSYYYFMKENLFSKAGFDFSKVNFLSGDPENGESCCEEYGKKIAAAGGIDIQLLGVGTNGHIGFNEPGIAFEKETHCVKLTERTIKANMRFFVSENDVPKEAYTMGIKTIMSAHRILVVVSGEDKAEAVKNAFFGPVTPSVPGSILQLHNDVTVVADEAALSLCEGLY